MKRRAFLSCALPVAIAGCTGGDPGDGSDGGESDDETETDGNDDSEVGESTYRVVVEPPESDPGEASVCEFEALPDAAQAEFEAAIEGVDFGTADRGEYESANSPALLDTDCYNGHIAYEDDYYWVGVEVEGG